MNADADIQVWLETVERIRPSIVVPYIKTDHDLTFQYRVDTTRNGRAGRSATTQSGTVRVHAHTATELARFSVSHAPNDFCRITIALSQPGKTPSRYEFDCPD